MSSDEWVVEPGTREVPSNWLAIETGCMEGFGRGLTPGGSGGPRQPGPQGGAGVY